MRAGTATLLTLLYLAPLVSGAGAPEEDKQTSMELEPFKAEYRISVSRIPIGLSAELELRPRERDDHYQIEFRIDSWLMNNTERSVFAWRDCEPRTEHYTHEFRGFGRRRNYKMEFDWGSPVEVTTTTRERRGDDETKTQEAPDNILDELTMLLQSRCILREGRQQYSVDTVYGTRIREHAVEVVGEETLSTPVGDMETLVIRKQRDPDSDRHTMFWVAPELDYMLIRARHRESRMLYGELNLRRYSGPM